MHVVPRPWLRRLDPERRFELRIVLFAIALILVAVPFSYLLFEVIREGPFTRFDETTANDLHRRVVGNDELITALHGISLLGKPLLLGICIAAGAIFAYVRGRRRLALFLVLTSIGGGLVDSAVKIAVNRPRPVVEEPLAHAFGKSFPSGHAMSSTVTYGALVLVFLPMIPRAWRWVVVGVTGLLVLAIGASRLLLGVHFVSDVLGGYALGLAWLCGCAALFNIWRVEEGKPKAEVVHEGLEPEAESDLTHPAESMPA
jgi:membrane-associated phospholipid phosphatase